jgi:hypothetical protein
MRIPTLGFSPLFLAGAQGLPMLEAGLSTGGPASREVPEKGQVMTLTGYLTRG